MIVGMKRIAIALVAGFLALLAVPALVAQDNNPNSTLFDSMTTMRDQLGIVRNVAEDDSGGNTDFYAHALNRLLVSYRNVGSESDKRDADDMAKILCQKLAAADHTASGPDLWRLLETFTNPLVKAEALKALGNVQAMDYFPLIVQLLTDLNNAPSTDRQNDEQIAYGAIESLEAYKDSAGYLPVFLASNGWYSARVKDRAHKALLVIMDNPAEPLVSIIKSSSYSYNVKYTALQALEASDITTQQKSAGAVAALSEIWRTSTSRTGQRSVLASIRKLSLNMIRRYGTEDANVYQYLERSYKEGIDAEEQIAAIATLSALATDDAARILASFLDEMTLRLTRDVLTKEDERMVRVIIPALGNTGRSLARTSLRNVVNSSWTGAVQRLAQDALKKIQ